MRIGSHTTTDTRIRQATSPNWAGIAGLVHGGNGLIMRDGENEEKNPIYPWYFVNQPEQCLHDVTQTRFDIDLCEPGTSQEVR